jgi:hypothetical protein
MNKSKITAMVMLTFCATLVSCGNRGTKPDNPIPAGHSFAQLRITLSRNDPGKEVYFYVETKLEGEAPLDKDIYLDEKEYQVSAVTPAEADEGAFYLISQRVNIVAGSNEVKLGFSSQPAPTPLVAEDVVPALVANGCPNGETLAYVDALKSLRGQFEARLNKAQYDPLVTELFNLYNLLQRQRSALGRITVGTVPVVNLTTGHSEETSLELGAAQIRHLADWLDGRKYDLGQLETTLTKVAQDIQKANDEAGACGDETSFRITGLEKNYVQNLLANVSGFRKQIRNVIDNIAGQLEEAQRSAATNNQ